MRLFTHNLLKCHVRNCTKDSFPLKVEDAQLTVKSAEYKADFLAMQMCKVDYEALLKTAQDLGLNTENLPAEAPEQPFSDVFLRALHHLLLENCIVNGKLVCRGCGHVYPVTDGIANMLLHEDEI